MNKIFKYPLGVPLDHGDRHVIAMPAGAKILSFQNQFGQAVVWAQVDPFVRSVNRTLRIFGTGLEIEGTRLSYVATAQFGNLVWHLYEER